MAYSSMFVPESSFDRLFHPNGDSRVILGCPGANSKDRGLGWRDVDENACVVPLVLATDGAGSRGVCESRDPTLTIEFGTVDCALLLQVSILVSPLKDSESA